MLSEPQPISPQQQHSLAVANYCAFVLHAALAVSAVVATLREGSVNAPTFWPGATWNATQCRADGYGPGVQICPSADAAEFFADVNFSAVLIISQATTALFHLWQALQAARPGSSYIQNAQLGIKLFHWIEYTFTAAFIASVVIYFSGILSIRAQLLGFAAQSTLMLVGLLQDVMRHCALRRVLSFATARAVILFSFVIGFANVCAVWLPSLARLWGTETEAPAFVKYVVLAEALLYSSFGIAQLAWFTPFLIYGAESTKRYFEEEMTLVVLSFLAKATLASVFSVCLVYRQCGN